MSTTHERKKAALAAVERMVCGDRHKSYGDACNHFAEVAAVASVVTGKDLEARDIVTIMCCLKLCRLKASPGSLDSWLDLGGYAVCGAALLPGNHPGKNSSPTCQPQSEPS